MLKNYLVVAIRNLFRQKAYTFINVLSLAIGLTCVALVGLYIQHEFGYDQHHANADRIYRVIRKQNSENGLVYSDGTLGPVGPALKRDFPEVEEIARFINRKVWLHYKDRGVSRQSCFASPGMLKVFPYPLVKGDPTALKDPRSAFISQSLARDLFGDEDPIGKVVSVDYKRWPFMHGDYHVSGILKDMPETSTGILRFDFLAMPNLPNYDASAKIWHQWRPKDAFHPVNTFVMLKSGLSVESLHSKLPEFTHRYLGETIAQTDGYELQPLSSVHLHSRPDYDLKSSTKYPYGNIRQCYTVGLIGLFILIIACVNYINLATARAIKRGREVGLRKVVGAHRSQLIRQFLGESALLSILALLLTLGNTELLLPVLNSALGKTLMVNMSLIALLTILTLLVSVLAGLYPAFYLSAFNPLIVLKGRHQTARSQFRQMLVVFQFAVAVVLIIATLVTYQQTLYIQNKDLGFTKENRIFLPIFRADTSLLKKYEHVKQRFLTHPNILRAAVSSTPPGRGSNVAVAQVQTDKKKNISHQMAYLSTGKDFFLLYKMPIVEGETFLSDGNNANDVLINEAARKTLGWDTATGKTLQIKNITWLKGKILRVRGVVGNFHNRPLQYAMRPMIITPYRNCYYLVETNRTRLKIELRIDQSALSFHRLCIVT